MKINLIILFFYIAICYSQESAGTSSSVATFDLELAAELEVIFELDQNTRNEKKSLKIRGQIKRNASQQQNYKSLGIA